MHRTKVRVVEDALDANNTIAQANRADFDRANVTVVNLMSAPGAGKTTLLERALEGLAEDGLRVGVLEGDVAGSFDADRLSVLHLPVVQLNTEAAPFNDKRARDAIYAATDFRAISQGLFRGQYPVSQSFTGTGGLFHRDTVEGYPPHDPARARQLVAEMGGRIDAVSRPGQGSTFTVLLPVATDAATEGPSAPAAVRTLATRPGSN